MLVVGFDTATPAVSVALHDGERVVSEAFALDARRHSELLTPMIAKVMADAGAARGDLTAVAVGVGLGWACDRWLGTRPWGLLVFLFLGIGAGMTNVYRVVKGLGMGVGYKGGGQSDASGGREAKSDWDDED